MAFDDLSINGENNITTDIKEFQLYDEVLGNVAFHSN